MFKTIVSLALTSGLALAAASTNAADYAYPTNPEHSATMQSAPTQKSRAEVLSEAAEFRASPVTGDGWKFVGGEREWALIQYQFALSGGQLVDTDHFDRNSPKPDQYATKTEQAESRGFYKAAL